MFVWWAFRVGQRSDLHTFLWWYEWADHRIHLTGHAQSSWIHPPHGIRAPVRSVSTLSGLFVQQYQQWLRRESVNCHWFMCRSVKASHVLISADGQVCMSGLRSIFSLIRHGQRAKVVHDFPQYSVKVLPWLSPEVLQQVRSCIPPQSSST